MSHPNPYSAKGASITRDAKGITVTIPKLLQEGSGNAAITLHTCIFLDALLHWAHDAKFKSTGEARLYTTYVSGELSDKLHDKRQQAHEAHYLLQQRADCLRQPIGGSCYGHIRTNTYQPRVKGSPRMQQAAPRDLLPE